MFRVIDVYDEAKKIIGACDDVKLFRWLGDAVTLIANKGDFEGWKGWVDICAVGCKCKDCGHSCGQACGRRLISLPREVEVPLAVNIGGHPALGLHQLFNFHLNGPGDCKHDCEWTWQDGGGFHATVRDIVVPSKLIAYLSTKDDNGKSLIVFGYDDAGNVLKRQEGGVWHNGYRVPTIFGTAVPDVGAPKIARITGIFKDESVGSIRLSTIDDSDTTGLTLGVYEPDETLPQYRRIILNRACNWARVAYMKTNPTFNSKFDHIPLKSRVGFLLGVTARKMYADLQWDAAHTAEADAARLEVEAQRKAEPPTYFPLQVVDMNNPRNKGEFDIR